MDIFLLILAIFRVANAVQIGKPRVEIMDRVILNQKLTMQCAIKMVKNSGMIQWLFKPHDFHSYKLLCMKRPDENECVKNYKEEKMLENFQMTSERVEIEKVSTNHSGTYQCKYMDSSNLEKSTIIVYVLTPPGKPRIHMVPTTVAENETVTLTCESFGGNPKPSLKWIWKDFSNKPIPKRNILNHTLTQTEPMYGDTVLTTLWVPKSFDDGNSISCLAANHLTSVSSNWMYLNVNFPPIIFDFPASPYFALLGSEINIECKATRKTATIIKWMSDKDLIVSDTAQLIIKSISKIHKGSYRCSVTNPFGTSSATLNITVLSSPVIELEKNLSIIENGVLRTLCKVIPSFSNVSWWMNTVLVSSTGLLDMKIAGVKPVQFQCRAYVLLIKYPGHHVMASSKETINVVVQYKPRKPSIAVHPIGNYMVGMDLTITCVPHIKEPGFPKPDYFWQKSNSRWTKNSTNFLSFSSLTFNDSGIYICSLYNNVGKSNAISYELITYGKPSLIGTTLPSPSLINVKEGQSLSILCQLQAYPAPEITWFNGENSISNYLNISGYRQEDKQTGVNTFRSLLHVDKTQSRTNEMYRCLATNKYGTFHKEFSIQIQYSPKLMSDIFMIAADSVGQSPGRGSVHLNCSVFGYPTVSIVWLRKLSNQNEKSIENSTERYFIQEKQLNHVVESILYVRNFQNEDYGRYFCMAVNKEGHLEAGFEIRKLFMPDPSHDLIVSKQTWNSLTLKWIAGFDGGFPQMFLVSYMTDMQTNPTQLQTSQPNITLTELLPDTLYAIIVSSSNKLGTTLATLSIKVKTEALVISDNTILTVNKEEHALELKLPSNISSSVFCLTVEEMEGNQDLAGSWTIKKKCLRDNNRLLIENPVNRFRVRICYINLPDVCSSPISNNAVPESTETILSTRLIGTVAAACTILVVILAILLFFILIRTRRLLPGLSELKDMKRNRKPVREDLSHFISKPLTSLYGSKHGVMIDSGGCPLLNTYSCDPVHLSTPPIEIFNVCSPHNIFNEGLYSTLVKSTSINDHNNMPRADMGDQHDHYLDLFANDISATVAYRDRDQDPCYCRSGTLDRQMMFTMPLSAAESGGGGGGGVSDGCGGAGGGGLQAEKIFYEVMV